MSATARLAVAIAVALAISLLARRARALSVDGTVAATVVGALALLAGWRWAVLLVVYFLVSSVLSRLGADRKNYRTQTIIEKGGERDAIQVLANGGVFAVAAALTIAAPQHLIRWLALGLAALAESASDTWATEIGTLFGGTPRSITNFTPIAPGMSGGVTLLGSVAALAGAASVVIVASLLGWPVRTVLASLVGGVVGSTLDSVLGATLQVRRRCDRCDEETERVIHSCGTNTRRVAGIPWMANDMVNLICGAVAGLLALAITE